MKIRHTNAYFTQVMSVNAEPLLRFINYKSASQVYRKTRHFSTFSKALLRATAKKLLLRKVSNFLRIGLCLQHFHFSGHLPSITLITVTIFWLHDD
jgi:hypothetical protein